MVGGRRRPQTPDSGSSLAGKLRQVIVSLSDMDRKDTHLAPFPRGRGPAARGRARRQPLSPPTPPLLPSIPPRACSGSMLSHGSRCPAAAAADAADNASDRTAAAAAATATAATKSSIESRAWRCTCQWHVGQAAPSGGRSPGHSGAVDHDGALLGRPRPWAPGFLGCHGNGEGWTRASEQKNARGDNSKEVRWPWTPPRPYSKYTGLTSLCVSGTTPLQPFADINVS